MKSMTADEAKRKFGSMLKDADDFAVEIRRHGRRRYVVMSAQLFDAFVHLWSAHRERKVLVAAESALDMLIAGADESGAKTLRIANGLMRRLGGQERG